MKRKTKKPTKKRASKKGPAENAGATADPQAEAKASLRAICEEAAETALGFRFVRNISGDVMVERAGSSLSRAATEEEKALWERVIDASIQLAGLFATMMGHATLTVQIRGGFPGKPLPEVSP